MRKIKEYTDLLELWEAETFLEPDEENGINGYEQYYIRYGEQKAHLATISTGSETFPGWYLYVKVSAMDSIRQTGFETKEAAVEAAVEIGKKAIQAKIDTLEFAANYPRGGDRP